EEFKYITLVTCITNTHLRTSGSAHKNLNPVVLPNIRIEFSLKQILTCANRMFGCLNPKLLHLSWLKPL
ncbi:MAG: hypothetical protein MHPSP_004542, partial [Paramarteilia canceri]